MITGKMSCDLNGGGKDFTGSELSGLLDSSKRSMALLLIN